MLEGVSKLLTSSALSAARQLPRNPCSDDKLIHAQVGIQLDLRPVCILSTSAVNPGEESSTVYLAPRALHYKK
jgi:hypothetical protein